MEAQTAGWSNVVGCTGSSQVQRVEEGMKGKIRPERAPGVYFRGDETSASRT
jgi:hypothetical protein